MVPREHARDLATALAGMTFTVLEGRFALVGLSEAPLPEDWAAVQNPPASLVVEREETSLLVCEGEVAGLLARHPSARVERPLSWIRFDGPMGWEVVGFLARVTGDLAREGIPVGVVCGFSRDHLFIAERYLPKVRACLSRSFEER